MPIASAVITGAGAVSPAGHSFADLAHSVTSGVSHIGWVTRFEPPGGGPVVASEADDYDLSEVLGSKKSRLDPAQAHFLAACRYALEESGWPLEHPLGDSAAISYGTSFGATASVEEYCLRLADKGPRYANPIVFTNSYINAAPSLAAIEWGIRGPNHTVCAGWVSGMAAMEGALSMIESGAARVALAGGSDALSEMLCADLAEAGCACLASSPERVAGSDGLVPGEGAGALVLEAPEAAQQRGATALGTLYASATEAGRDLAAAYTSVLGQVLAGGVRPVLYLSPANGFRDTEAAERSALGRTGVASWGCRRVRLSDTIGETFGAASPLAVGLALRLLHPGETALVGALGPGYAGAAVVSRGGAE